MKATGIVRKLDGLGRLVLPKEIRKSYKIEEKEALEIYVDGSFIMLKKYEQTCTFCKQTTELEAYKEKQLCKQCIKEIEKMAEG